MSEELEGGKQLPVRHNCNAHRYEVELGDELAVLEYLPAGSEIIFSHTEVPPAYRESGIASALVRYALDDARQRGLRVVPLCPFVAHFVRRHADYQDLVVRR